MCWVWCGWTSLSHRSWVVLQLVVSTQSPPPSARRSSSSQVVSCRKSWRTLLGESFGSFVGGHLARWCHRATFVEAEERGKRSTTRYSTVPSVPFSAHFFTVEYVTCRRSGLPAVPCAEFAQQMFDGRGAIFSGARTMP